MNTVQHILFTSPFLLFLLITLFLTQDVLANWKSTQHNTTQHCSSTTQNNLNIMSIASAASSLVKRGYPALRSYQRPQIPFQLRSYSLTVEPVATPFFKIDLSLPSLWSEFTLLIKRTFQPSIIRKRRKTGFLKRHKSVGGRRVLDRRVAKGRIRLGGC